MTKPALRSTDRLAQTVAALARLLDQTRNDIQALDSEFQEQMEAAQEGHASIEQHYAERSRIAVEQAEANARELQLLRLSVGSWEAEKAELVVECERTRQLLEQARREHDEVLAETDEAAAIALERQVAGAVERVRAEVAARWEADRATLTAERNRAQQRLADLASEYEKKLADAAATQSADRNEVIRTEIARVEVVIHGISQVVENPETELSMVIRKNVERAELESYLRGLRFKT